MSALSRLLAPLVTALLLTICAGCVDTAGRGDSIVVTTNILGDLTAAVVGDAAEVTVLMNPGADPHHFAVSAPQAARMERADLIVHNGLGLEEGVARHVDAAVQAGVASLAVGELVEPLRYRPEVGADRPDPHFWTDPRRVARAVEAIRDAVLAHTGADAAAIRARTETCLRELDDLDRWMTERLATVPAERRKLVTNHHVFGYLAQRYGFEVIGAVLPGGTTLASPSASDLSELAVAVRTAGVPAIFADTAQPDRLARVLAAHAGLHVRVIGLQSESLSAPGAGAATYLEMMRTNTEAIVSGLTADG
ncbi:zinc ABC transporter substrate-binding protein AztC [Nocardia shimofusensis]|uniref:zinc ABC transporter substrate-binding protein AztC n=1 Tax=Nocardia shimofusensis TaxID=228596 RepID=UPI0008379629|nr:zinc ABC transporter substrate-binding protein AztC [Nocardia shimofusensis]